MESIINVDLSDIFLSTLIYQLLYGVIGIICFTGFFFKKKEKLSFVFLVAMLCCFYGYVKVTESKSDKRIERIMSCINASGIHVDNLTEIYFSGKESPKKTKITFWSVSDKKNYIFKVEDNFFQSDVLNLYLSK